MTANFFDFVFSWEAASSFSDLRVVSALGEKEEYGEGGAGLQARQP